MDEAYPTLKQPLFLGKYKAAKTQSLDGVIYRTI